MSTLKIQTPQGPLCLDDAPHGELARETDDSSPLPRVAYAATHVAMAATYSDVPHQPEAPGDAARIADNR